MVEQNRSITYMIYSGIVYLIAIIVSIIAFLFFLSLTFIFWGPG